MKKFYTIFFLVLIVFSGNELKATHIVGGVINYEHIGGTTYEITMNVYRDCFFGQAGFDNPAVLGIYNQNGFLIDTIDVLFPVINQVNPPINNPCLIVPPNICVEEGKYTTTYTFPNASSGYHIVYQRCCRNNTISNVNLPVGATYTAYIPPTNLFQNSNPEFNTFPPLFVCVNAPLVYNHSATDIDGDSLVYELCAPFAGGDTMDPAPNPPSGPPFPNVVWNNPFNLANPLGGTPLSINPNSGVLTGVPNTIGQFVVGVCVTEYRNGVFLSRTIRDFQFNVTACNVPTANIPSSNIDPNTGIGDFTEVCEDDPFVTFVNNSSGAIAYEWDFGDPSTTNDNSTAFEPSYSYPNDGVYLVTLVAVNNLGCTDTTRAIVIVHPLPTVNLMADTTICPNSSVQLNAGGGIAYSWTPAGQLDNANISNPIATPPYVGGLPVTYYVTITDNNRCQNTDSIIIDFLPLPVADAGEDTSVCLEPGSFRDSVQLNATGGVSYEWSPGVGLTDSTIANPISRPPGNMVYHVTVTDANGCINNDSVLVFFLDPQIDLIADVDTEICIYDTIQVQVFDQGPITTYSWSPTSFLSDPDEREPFFYPVDTTLYILSVSNYCYVKDDSLRIIVNPLPLAEAGARDSVCLGDSIELSASGGVTYQWQFSSSLSNLNIQNPIAFPDDTIQYFVTVTDSNGCVNMDSIEIIVHLLPDPVTTVDDSRDHICFGQSVILRSAGGVAYQWLQDSTLTFFTGDSTIATPPDTSIYFVDVTNIHDCVARDSVQVNVQHPIEPSSDPNRDVCEGSAVQLRAFGGLYYDWSPTESLNFSNIYNPIATPDISTIYTVYISNDCFGDSVDVELEIRPLPKAEAGPDHVIYRESSAILDGSGDGYYRWTPVDDLDDPNNADPEASPLNTTVYYLRVTTEFGCVDFDSTTVTVVPINLLLLPTGFTPNNDGTNDFFRIVRTLNVERLMQFSIFNRWGEKVFETTDINGAWDGTYKNEPQEIGTYVYYIKYQNYDGRVLEENGNVTLLR